jgi:hypothetical protein
MNGSIDEDFFNVTVGASIVVVTEGVTGLLTGLATVVIVGTDISS